MAVATLEAALASSLRYYLCHFPEKLPRDPKHSEGLAVSRVDHAVLRADTYVHGLGYKSVAEYLDRYLSLLSLPNELAPELVNMTVEIKATRNLMMHNDLVINKVYVETAGPLRRSGSGGRLEVSPSYVQEGALSMKQLFGSLSALISRKYCSYTRLQANRRLWDFMFDTPLLKKYEDYWEVDEADDRVFAFKKCERERSLSHSEAMLLSLWRTHFTGKSESLYLNMRSLVGKSRARVLFFLSIADVFPLY